jgi:hypothetical protein
MHTYKVSVTLDGVDYPVLLEDHIRAESLDDATMLAVTRYLELPATVVVEPA